MNIAVSILFVVALLAIASRAASAASGDVPSLITGITGAK